MVGGALAAGSVLLLSWLGFGLIMGLIVGAFVLRRRIPAGRAEMAGLAAGPGFLFMVIGELDDAPGLVLIGMAVLALAAAIYVDLRRREAQGRKRGFAAG